MNIWEVWMGMLLWLVKMPMRVGLTRWVIRTMGVLMVFIVGVLMFMFYHLMNVFMDVALSKVKPKTRAHQYGGYTKPN